MYFKAVIFVHEFGNFGEDVKDQTTLIFCTKKEITFDYILMDYANAVDELEYRPLTLLLFFEFQ